MEWCEKYCVLGRILWKHYSEYISNGGGGEGMGWEWEMSEEKQA